MRPSTIFTILLIFPIFSAILVYFIGRAATLRSKGKPGKVAFYLAVGSVLITAVFYALAASEFFRTGPIDIDYGSIKLSFDALSLVMSGTLLLLTFVVILFSSAYLSEDINQEKYYAQVLVLMTSILGLTSATDLFNIYVWYELMAISTYSLVAFYRERLEPLEAAIKYLVQSAAGSSFIILAIAILFGAAGKIAIPDLQNTVSGNSTAFIASVALFVIGYGIKAALVPMHFWLPDAHSQAPAGISALLSGIVIETGLTALLKSLSVFKRTTLPIGTLFLIFGAVNMLVGNLSALRQKEIKRMFAFSSISHMGYIALGTGFALTSAASAQLSDGIFLHIFNHAMMKGLAFLSAGAIVYYLKNVHGSHEPLYVEDLNGISQQYPLFAFCLSVAVLALGGLPLFSGFISKWKIMASGAAAGGSWNAFLIVFLGLNSVLSLGYYAPLVNRMYRNKGDDTAGTIEKQKVSKMILFPLILLTVGIIFFGLFPMALDSFSDAAGNAFYTMFY